MIVRHIFLSVTLGFCYLVGLQAQTMNSTAYQSSTPLFLESNNVKIGSSQDAGGSVTQLWYKYPAFNFINIADFGREMQSAVFWRNDGTAYNPTEAGSYFYNL